MSRDRLEKKKKKFAFHILRKVNEQVRIKIINDTTFYLYLKKIWVIHGSSWLFHFIPNSFRFILFLTPIGHGPSTKNWQKFQKYFYHSFSINQNEMDENYEGQRHSIISPITSYNSLNFKRRRYGMQRFIISSPRAHLPSCFFQLLNLW